MKPKVLFLGDSFTASIEVSNEKSFFNLLKDSLGIEVFAYGHAGYGTLQEFMILDRWVDVIKPDLIVWEVCSNDFIDNYAPLEIRCGYKVGQRRPYLNPDGSIHYRIPVSFFQKMQKQFLFLEWVVSRSEHLFFQLTGREKRVGEYFISVDKLAYPPFAESVAITRQIVGKIKKRLPANTAVLGFSADAYQPQMETFKNIFEEQGFLFSEKPARMIDLALYRKQIVRSHDDCHWNERGNEIVASGLLSTVDSLLRN